MKMIPKKHYFLTFDPEDHSSSTITKNNKKLHQEALINVDSSIEEKYKKCIGKKNRKKPGIEKSEK